MRVSVNLNAQKPDTTTNAVIYARYSSHGQTEQSIEGQLAKGHEYAAAQGYTVVHEYIDRAMTGRNDNREAFQKMLSDTGKHQFQVVIVWKVDRFGRNREEIAFNKHTCKKNGVRVEYVAESLPNSPEAVILESVLEGMAEYYSIQLSQNIRRGQLESAKKCQCVGGSVPLGYTLDSDKHFVIDPQTAPVVKKIFDLYAEGATISEITGQLNEQGIRTARKQLFTKNSLTKLLKNEKYIGVYTYKDIVRVEGGVPAIVDKSTFDRVQELLKINRRAPSHTWTKVEYLLTDKLFCGHCGSPMVGESGFSHTGAKYSYYGCIKRRREKACDKKPVRQDWIEALVLDETVKLLHDDELMEYIIDRTWEYYQVTDKVQEEKAVLEAQLAEVDKAINNLVRAIEAGIFNAATKSRMDELDAQKAALTASLADLELTSGIRITRDHIEYFLLRLRDLDVKDRECQKRLVQTFVNAVFIYDDGRVKITYNYSGQSSTITLNQIASAEKGKGFVCCLPCSGSAHCMGYPIAVVLASTWNQELVEQMGECIGEDGLKSGVQGWYAPGAGTHRTPYGGRNFEYYSEDGFLSGKICAAEVRGAQSKGMYVYLKHLVLNDQEDRRYGIATFCQEQVLRELYMTPFEICVKEADAHGMMAAFDSIGGIWCGANEDLLEDVLRGEWGFRGIVVTDYATANGGYMWIDMGLQNGGDLWLNSDKTVYWIDDIENNATLVNSLRRASHNILYTVVNSAAMNGFSEKTEIRNVLPEWQIWMICADAAVLVVTVTGVLLIVRRCRKNRSSIQVVQVKAQV